MIKDKKIDINKIEVGVMDRIHDNKTHIRSKSYYLLLGLLSIAAIVFMIFIATYCVSVASLWLRLQAAQGPAYRLEQNLSSLLESFPIWALCLGIVSTVSAIYLIRKSGKMYKLRLAYFIPIVAAAIVAVGFAFSYSSLPNTFGGRGLNNNSPFVRGHQRNR